jgi:hypothetical protein
MFLDRTPFYARWAASRRSRIAARAGTRSTEVGKLRVIDTQKRGDVFVHRGCTSEGRAPEPAKRFAFLSIPIADTRFKGTKP